MNHPRFDDDATEHQGSANYVQIATPKSPNSDGFEEEPLEQELKNNIVKEVDLEILLKHREYNLVQNEIERVQQQLSLMENVHDDHKYATFIQELIKLEKSKPIEDKTTGAQNYNLRKSSTHHEQQQHRTSYGGLRPIMDANGNKVCVHKRSDGVIVRIDCPKCGRTDFGSAQGFLNHARLAHSIEYKSQEDAALQCGSIMPELDQDEVGVSSIRKLKELGLDGDKTLCPGVCIEDPVKKKRRMSKDIKHLQKLYGDEEVLKKLVDDVAIEPIEDESEPEEEQFKQKKRRKSSAVKFELVSPTELEEDLTASQRRRVPSVSEPLRTRSRSSRESSH